MKHNRLIAILVACFLFLWIDLNAAPITSETAKTIAIHWMSSQHRQRSSVPTIKHVQLLENVYLCELENGFVLVSSDDRLYPVIGYSENTGIKDVPPALRNWIQQYRVSDQQTVNRQTKAHPLWETLLKDRITGVIKASSEVLPLIKTQWNQNFPWNEKCPMDINGPGGRAYAGCVAVAMAQIMKYWGFPVQGTGIHSYKSDVYGTLSVSFDINYPWGNMSDTTANDSVKTLLYHCGISVDMDYGPIASSADAKYGPAHAWVTYFKYSPSIVSAERSDYTDNDWLQMIRQELSEKRPILYYGRNQNNQNGHAFVCDGYQSNGFFHFNWGWGGSFDGYYALNTLTPDSDSDYSYQQGAVFKIEPSSPVSLIFPYKESFEGDLIPDPWIVKGDDAYVGLKEAHSGVKSLLLNDYTTTETGIATAQLKINVPEEGASLRFYIKRGYSPSPSDYNQHKAEIRTEFGETVLHSFFEGDFNDLEWQAYYLDLTPWKSQIIRLYFEQNNSSTEKRQWMSIDDVSIKQEPIANFDVNNRLVYDGQTIQFKNLSTMANNFLWQFGDDMTSLEAHPTHQYKNPGRYTITLTVNNGDASLVKYNYIHVLPKYTPSYTLENGGNFETRPDDFASVLLDGSINLWEHGTPGNVLYTAHSDFQVWKTGLSIHIEKENYTSALVTPLFNLSAPGTYAVQFYHQMDTYYNNCPGAAWMEFTLDEGQTWNRLGTYENNPVGSKNWYNRSSHDASPDNAPCWWKELDSWTCARLMIPEFVGQASVGFRFVYRVESGWGGELTYLIDGWSIDDFEIQYIPPTADFEHSKLAYVGQPIQFIDRSVYASSWRWSFGDQTISTDQHANHTYTAPGYYTISLEINNATDVCTHEQGIHVLPERGIPYLPEKGGNFDTHTDDFDSQRLTGSIDMWEHGQPDNAQIALQSNSQVWKTGLNVPLSKDNYQCALYTPNYKPTQKGTYALSFDMSMDVTYANGPFAVQCQYSTDNGQSWFRLGEDNDTLGQNWYNRGPSSDHQIDSSIFTDQMGWTSIVNHQPVSYPMNLDVSVQQIAFRFVLSVVDVFSDGYDRDGFMIDNISLTGPSSGQPDLWVSQHQLVLSALAGSKQINIENMGENDLSWQVVSDIQWLDIQPTGGQNDTVITISYDENTSQARTGCITIQAENALNGVQSLCIIQDSPATSPVISMIADTLINENSPGKYVYFTVTDQETPGNQLNLWAESSNPTLIPNDYTHLAMGGPVDQRHLFLLPAPDQKGVAVISIYARDTDGLTGQRDFTVTVQKEAFIDLDINHDNRVNLNDLILGLQVLSGDAIQIDINEQVTLAIVLQIFYVIYQ
ncbi:MAG: C10 family peptidase [Candidatus Magnetomorum sp.]|nr:C10 family peptidase [Candidatus Magnetomorum sp.]